ncbi:similar to transcription factor Cys6 [Botrytis cinerea T4]|uniref:Similar to transcription factor Cys6 n=1 Tax=Botryotinia fuckeliana (strain T4) TaxID=999810 RepID=G2YVT2_BOTF4|nr:similar to transcription factor Cys6 [Botrytis cinerea T4]
MAQTGTFSWVSERPHISHPITPNQKPHSNYRPRKSNTKSRNGCHNCRKRRIKCDEAKPSCGQCSDRLLGAVQCEYLIPQKPVMKGQLPSEQQISTGRICSTSVRDQIISYLEKSEVPCSHFKDPIYKPGDTLELLDHFTGVTTLWIGSQSFQKIIQQHGLRISLRAPCLMHAILAFSASHLHYLHPKEKKYNIAFTLHYSKSLSSYLSELRTSLNSSNADAIIASSYLHTMLTFRNIQPDQNIEIDGSGRVTWLRAMRGVSTLWDTNDMNSHLQDSIMLNMKHDPKLLNEGPCNHDKPNDVNPWALETSRALHRLFEEENNSKSFKDSYERPLRHLCQLIRLGTDQDTVCTFMSFVGELPESFIKLLDQKDPRALLILCYWSALLSQKYYWWVRDPATAVCGRLCAYLDRIPDEGIRSLLYYPASLCGYTMNSAL